MDDQLDRRTKRTRQALQSALVALILEKGYDSVTVMDVAQRADYNRGTFYNHYLGKEELLSEIREDFLKGFEKALLAPYKGMQKVQATQTYPSILQLFEHVEGHKDVFQALIAVDKGLVYEMNSVMRESMRRDMHIEMEKTEPPIDYEIMLSYQMSATVGVIMYWAETNFKYSASYMAEQLIALVRARIDHITFKRQP